MISGMEPKQLVDTILAHASGKRDLIAPTKELHFSHSTQGVIRLSVGSDDLALTSLARNQVTSYLNIPSKFASRLEADFPDLLVHNLNTIMEKQEGRRMVRTLDGNARAFMSDSYRRIDNELVFDGMYPVLTRLKAKIESVNVSDDYFQLQATMPKVEGEIRKGDVVRYGVAIRNSEVGRGALSISPLIYRLVCTNGMVLADQVRRHAHIGGSYLDGQQDLSWVALSSETQMLKTRVMIAELGEYLEAMASPEMFQKTLASLREAGDEALPAEPTMVVESLGARYNLNKPETESALIALAESKDYSRWGLANAVTILANSSDNYDRAVELETLGGRIMQLNKLDYNALARMPKASEIIDAELVEA
jgi:hypothetical protein